MGRRRCIKWKPAKTRNPVFRAECTAQGLENPAQQQQANAAQQQQRASQPSDQRRRHVIGVQGAAGGSRRHVIGVDGAGVPVDGAADAPPGLVEPLDAHEDSHDSAAATPTVQAPTLQAQTRDQPTMARARVAVESARTAIDSLLT